MDEFLRQREILTPEDLAPYDVDLVGGGSLGGAILLGACKMGLGVLNRITVTDHDHCTTHNLPTQWFGPQHVRLEQYKVEALEEMIAWVRKTGEHADFVISLCDGAFVLAAAGLLDGHTATTFPGDQDRFAEAFPDVGLEREPSFVQDDRMLTSQGGAKSYDVAMHLVDLLYGEKVAKGVGRGLIIPWPPE